MNAYEDLTLKIEGVQWQWKRQGTIILDFVRAMAAVIVLGNPHPI